MKTRKKTSSIADSLRASSVDSADDFQLAQSEARTAEKERMLASQQRKAMLESLRASVARKHQTTGDRQDKREQFVRLIRDGLAADIDREIQQILRTVRAAKHKGDLSRAAESIASSFADKAKVFVEKKGLLERIEKRIEAFRASDSDEKAGSTGQARAASDMGREKILLVARSLRSDLMRMMNELLALFEKLEEQMETDAREEENARRFFYGCISSLDEKMRGEVMAKCHVLCRNASVEKRRAIYRAVVENLAKANQNVARKIHGLARKKAREFIRQGRLEDAVSELGAAIRLWRDDSDTFRLLSSVLSKKGDKRGALVTLQEVVRLCPDDISVWKRLAKGWEDLGEEDRALNMYDEVVSRSPDDRESIRHFASLLFKKGKFHRVAKILQEHIHSFANDPNCQFWLGASWYRMGEPRKAIPLLRRAIDSRSDQEEAIYLLVLSYRDAEMWDEASSLQEEYLRRFPDRPRAHLVAGLLREAQGDLEGAETSFLKVVENQGESYPLLLSTARTQMERGSLDEAIDTLNRAIQLDGKKSEAFLELGKAQRQKGEHDRAEEALKKALEIDQSNSAAKYELSMVYMETGRWELAKKML